MSYGCGYRLRKTNIHADFSALTKRNSVVLMNHFLPSFPALKHLCITNLVNDFGAFWGGNTPRYKVESEHKETGVYLDSGRRYLHRRPRASQGLRRPK